MRSLAMLLLASIPASASDGRAGRLLLEDKQSVAVFQTAKTAQAFADCAHAALFKVRPAVEQIPDGDSRLIRVRNLGNTQVIVRVTPTGDGAAVDYRARSRYGNGKFTDAILGCK